MVESYPDLNEQVHSLMQKYAKESPDVMDGFMQIHKSASQDAALPKKMKELISLGIAICVRCDGCIAFHVHDALEKGATRDEIVETIGVAILMGGGPSVVYGSQALRALEEFQEEKE